jgi:hypothetical protein
MVSQWIQFAQNATLGSHPYTLEDGRQLPKEPGPHASVGGEVLEGMYAGRCTSIEASRISGSPGREGVLRTVSGASPDPAGTVSKDPLVVPT